MFLIRSTSFLAAIPCPSAEEYTLLFVLKNLLLVSGTIHTPKAFFTFPILDAATAELAGDEAACEAACAPSICALEVGISKSAISNQAGNEEVY